MLTLSGQAVELPKRKVGRRVMEEQPRKKKKRRRKQSAARRTPPTLERDDEDEFNSLPLKSRLMPESLKEIEDMWLDGVEEEELSKRFGLRVEEIHKHIQDELVNKYSSRYDRAGMMFDRLFSAIGVAHGEYMENPTQGQAIAYSSMINSFRGALVDLDNLQNTAEVADDIIKIALNPLLKKMVQVLIDELGSFKEILASKFGEEASTKISNEVASRVSSHFKVALEDTRGRLEGVLGTQDKNRKRAVEGKANSGKKKNKHLKAV
jgi:hypothetical protein